MGLYIGLMSGTSLDGVDGVLADLRSTASGATDCGCWPTHHQPFAPTLREPSCWR